MDERPVSVPPERVADDAEALFPEARRRQRRRRQIIGLVVATVIASVAVIVAATRNASIRVPNGAPRVAGSLPASRVTTLRLAGPLAVAPDGGLYVADLARQQVLLRLRDGRFRVVAGNGRAGFAGDGGPAVRARLSAISDLAFAPGGALYVADAGRVREVSADGLIRTVAGNGRKSASGLVANGEPAPAAALGSTRSIEHSGGSLWISVGPSGQLYISTGSQVLELVAGRLDVVPATIPAGPLKGNLNDHRGDLGPIAVDAHGDIDVAGVNGWSIWQIANGTANQIGTGSQGSARQSGGSYSVLQRAPDGTVYGENGATLLRVDHNRLIVSLAFSRPIAHEYFGLTYFAFAPNGTIYADELPGGLGFEAREQLLVITKHRVKLLWEQPSRRYAYNDG